MIRGAEADTGPRAGEDQANGVIGGLGPGAIATAELVEGAHVPALSGLAERLSVVAQRRVVLLVPHDPSTDRNGDKWRAAGRDEGIDVRRAAVGLEVQYV